MNYDFEIPRICEEIKERGAKRVLIQLPEGLKVHAVKIADEIKEKTGCEVVISGDPCFGACDIQKLPECDFTVHFAHSKMLDDSNIIYIECKCKDSCTGWINDVLEELEGKKVGLITTIQHMHELEEVKKMLEERGAEVHICGQVLGCDASKALDVADKVDCFLFIGSGEFHPLNVAYRTKKPVFTANGELNGENWEKEVHLRKERAHDARAFAVVVGVKPGQKHMDMALAVKKKLEDAGKKAYIVTMNEISPEKIDYLPFDAFVITACPRLVLDDWKNFEKPLLLAEEI